MSKTKNTNETQSHLFHANHTQSTILKHCHGNGFNIANSILRSEYVLISWRARTAANYVYWLHALFIYLIPEDVLSEFSTIFGVTGAL